ncbi:LOW QUALITY PROTEIN: hypothetical protein MAR_005777, partial [Mya arenaria]
MMHMKCIQNGYCVSQEKIKELLHIFYPNDIKHRQQRRLQRREYLNLDPNYLWYIDGYDKLKPFGICIQGAIDGFSRYLEAYKTNNDPKLISGYYTETVNMMDACPLRVRADLGTENCYVRDIHMYLRSITEDHDQYEPKNRKMMGHTTNAECPVLDESTVQKLHGDLFRQSTAAVLLHGCYTEELDEVRQLWNCPRIRPVRNNISPSGRPVKMYTCPELYGAQDYLCGVPRAN